MWTIGGEAAAETVTYVASRSTSEPVQQRDPRRRGGEVDDETTTYVSELTAEQVNSDVRVLSRDREFDVI